MQLMTRRFRRGKKGFTLIELIVVMAIIAILAMIAVPRLAQFRELAEQRKNEANERILTGAAAMAVAEFGAPGEWGGLTVPVVWPGSMKDGVSLTDTSGKVYDNAYAWGPYFDEWPAPSMEVSIDAEGNVEVNDSGSSGGVTEPDPVTTAFEAETGQLNGNAQIQDSSSASGGQVIGNLNVSGDWVQINGVSGNPGGDAILVIRYSRRTGNGSMAVHVNGVKVGQFTFPKTGNWDNFTNSQVIDLGTFTSGATYSVRVGHDGTAGSAAIDVDVLTITVTP